MSNLVEIEMLADKSFVKKGETTSVVKEVADSLVERGIAKFVEKETTKTKGSKQTDNKGE